jgi:ribosomal protein L32
MIICPVCEHQQAQGDECDNCGKKLQAPRPVAVAVAALPELEQTQLPGGRAPVAADVVPELEVTRLKAGPDLPAQVVPDLDPTRMDRGALASVPVEQMPDMDTGRAEDDGVRTMAPIGPVVCRYCRNVQSEGLVCDKCGMRLPRARPAEAQQPGRAAANASPWVDCPRCRTPNRPGTICATCGTRLPSAEV